MASLFSEPMVIDPVVAYRHSDATLASLIFDSLYRIDSEGLVRPSLAAKLPSLADGGKLARISIREDVEFHGGETLSASDVADSIRRVLRSKRTGWLLAFVRRVDVAGNDVVLRLWRPEPQLARILAATQTSITRGGRSPSWSNAKGTGPYRLVRVERRARRVLLRAFDRHFAGRAYLDNLDLRWHMGADDEARSFELGRSHTSMRGQVAFVGHVPKYAASALTTAGTVTVFLGVGDSGVLSPEFAHAVSLAIDRRGFRGLGNGERVEPSSEAASRTLHGGANSISSHLDRARRLLERARASSDALRRRLTTGAPIAILVDRSAPGDREVADRVLAALFRLNVPARIEVVDASVLYTRISRGAFELYVGHDVAPVADAGWQAASAVAVAEPERVRQELRRRSPTAAAMAVMRRSSRRVVPLFHRGLRLFYRSNLYGFESTQTGRIEYDGVFMHGNPRTPSRRPR